MSRRTRLGRGDPSDDAGALSRIRNRLAETTVGEGGVVYVEGAPGSGKTELMTATAEAARDFGIRVLAARGSLLEREFAFGVAIQLLEEAWFAAGPSERASLIEGPARPAGELLSGESPAGPGLAGERLYAVIHGLFWLVRGLAPDAATGMPGGPVALIVDDIDYVDGPSLRFLAYLALRIPHLPIVLCVAGHSEPASADPPALSALRFASEVVPAGRVVAKARAVVARTGTSPTAPAEGPRALAAHMALQKSLAEGHRESVVDLAELAWSNGALLESDGEAGAWPEVAGSLLFVDELELALEVAQTAMGPGDAAGPPAAAASAPSAARWQSWSFYHQGRITAALAVAEAARAADPTDRAARGVIAACRLAQGRIDEAEAALTMVMNGAGIDEIDGPVLLDLRAELRLAQLRPSDALADAVEAGRLSRGASRVMGPGVVAWRSTAALARLALGEGQRARALAQEELELARERGLTRVVIRDLRVLAFAAKGTRRLDLLSEAVRVGRAAPPRLEYINALVDLGGATRRANQRIAARHPLHMALELAERGGAAALARRAREELDATGARSRRVLFSGIQALTPSERRVADLAARGFTTRQIAQTLFVTPKTVEFHLRHIYRKLDIPSSRADLARALSAAASG